LGSDLSSKKVRDVVFVDVATAPFGESEKTRAAKAVQRIVSNWMQEVLEALMRRNTQERLTISPVYEDGAPVTQVEHVIGREQLTIPISVVTSWAFPTKLSDALSKDLLHYTGRQDADGTRDITNDVYAAVWFDLRFLEYRDLRELRADGSVDLDKTRTRVLEERVLVGGRLTGDLRIRLVGGSSGVGMRASGSLRPYRDKVSFVLKPSAGLDARGLLAHLTDRCVGEA
jgi:hypothetical protein